jgi:hypothetical protein
MSGTTTTGTGRVAAAAVMAVLVVGAIVLTHGAQNAASPQAKPGVMGEAKPSARSRPGVASESPSGIKVGFQIYLTSVEFRTGPLHIGLAEWELGGQHYTDAITNTPEFRPSHSDYLKWYSIEQPAEPGQRVTFTSTLDYGYAKSEQYICTIIGRDRHGVPHSLKVADPGPKPVCKVEARVPANW